MKQRAVAIIADYLSHRSWGRVVRVKCIGDDDYVLAIEDVRDGRVHVVSTPQNLEAWLESFMVGECLQPAFGLCGTVTASTTTRTSTARCSAPVSAARPSLVEIALELGSEQEAE